MATAPRIQYTPVATTDEAHEADTCSVCLQPLGVPAYDPAAPCDYGRWVGCACGATPRRWPCGHAFHVACVALCDVCPVCRGEPPVMAHKLMAFIQSSGRAGCLGTCISMLCLKLSPVVAGNCCLAAVWWWTMAVLGWCVASMHWLCVRYPLGSYKRAREAVARERRERRERGCCLAT